MIGKKIKALIKKAKVKQVDFASQIGISPSRLSNYLSDKREPDFDMLTLMAKCLNVDMNYFSDVDFSKAGKTTAVKEQVKENSFDVDKQAYMLSVVPMNAKKRSLNAEKIAFSAMFMEGIANPCEDAAVFEINGYVASDVACENDYIVCVKCSSIKLANGDRIFENGRNARFFKFYQDDKAIMLVNDDKTKEPITAETTSDLDNFYKVLWVFKKH